MKTEIRHPGSFAVARCLWVPNIVSPHATLSGARNAVVALACRFARRQAAL
ncbi:hypothetical protein [Nonomuraea rosea]|uniref:hypothetical protein n=1 Tax=Nonomuraea rosea TaxID=638574 RepID=UPI0031F178B1